MSWPPLDHFGAVVALLLRWYAKVEIALATGKREYDKRQTIAAPSQASRSTGRWLLAIEDNEAMVQFRASVARAPLGVRGRFARGVVAFLLMSLTAAAWALVAPTAAYAADDQIDFTIDYNVQPSGVVKVKGTITYRFGDNSGRHGIERFLVTREPYDETQDAVYQITNISVTSPDDVATQFSSRTDEAKAAARSSSGCASATCRTISAPTATYVISYDLAGADAHLRQLRRVLLGCHRSGLDGLHQAGGGLGHCSRRRSRHDLHLWPGQQHRAMRGQDR